MKKNSGMNQIFQLRSILNNRANDVLFSRHDTALGNLKIFFEFIENNLILKSVLEELSKDLPDPEPLIAQIKNSRRAVLPSSYLYKVRACLSLLKYMIEKNEQPWEIMAHISASRNINSLTSEAFQEFFVPVYKYIDERIISIDSFLYFLIRFKLKCEWFEREKLFNLYSKDTSKGESNLDKILRAYLFDQGIDFPFSKPSSPSGEVDVLSVIKQKPIPLEVKIFDGKGRSRSHIRQGFRQALNYAKDYDAPSAYLVVFNVSHYDLVFKLSSLEFPQKLAIDNKTIYFFSINLYPYEKSASKRDLKIYEITEEYLLKK